MGLRYAAHLTGAPFMMYEFKQVVSLKQQGFDDDEIRTKVIDENLFQYEKLSSMKRALPSILRRVHVLDDQMRKWVLEEGYETANVLLLYAIMKTDRLFFEFMDEVVREKFIINDLMIEPRDINTYFTVKAEQDKTVASWSDETVRKLKQVVLKILTDVGLWDRETKQLSRLFIDDPVKDYLQSKGEGRYVQAMGG